MVRILGNSVERVPLKDLNDVIYYKQVKEYTDSEYRISVDLKRGLAQGRLTIIDQEPGLRGTVDSGNGSESLNNGMSKGDLKDAIREVMSEGKSNVQSYDMAGVMRELIDTVKQEISSKLSGMSFGDNVGRKTESSKFVGPEYIPTISTEGMTSNIKAEEKQVAGGDMNDALSALRNMNNK